MTTATKTAKNYIGDPKFYGDLDFLENEQIQIIVMDYSPDNVHTYRFPADFDWKTINVTKDAELTLDHLQFDYHPMEDDNDSMGYYVIEDFTSALRDALLENNFEESEELPPKWFYTCTVYVRR